MHAKNKWATVNAISRWSETWCEFEGFNEVERLWRCTTCKLFIRSSEGRRAEGAGGKTRTITGPHPALELSSVGAK